jgi:hypothetical protein
MKFHPDVLAAHAQFGGDLEDMQRNYDSAAATHPNEKPASPTTTAKGVTEALLSDAVVHRIGDVVAEAFNDVAHVGWLSVNSRVEIARAVLTAVAALSLPASPTQGELAMKGIADLLRRIRSDRGHGAGWVGLLELDEIDAALSALDRTTLPITEGISLAAPQGTRT